MKTFVSILGAVAFALLCYGPSARAQVYRLDDGTAETSYGYFSNSTPGNPGSIWLNEFPLAEGYHTIASVSIAWGSPGAPFTDHINGLPMMALLYDDPNGDGSPLDGTLLTSVTGTIQSADTNSFVTYAFSTPVTVTTPDFFVGFYLPGFTSSNGVRQFYAALDESATTIPGRSFYFGNRDGSTPSITDLSVDTEAHSNATAGIPGNWLVRANAVPEPSAWALVIAAGTGACAVRVVRARRQWVRG